MHKQLLSLLLLPFLAILPIKPAAQPLSAELRAHQGRPTIFVNGRPEAPVFYALTDVPGGRWSWEEVPQQNLRNFCEAGIRLFQVDLFLEQCWLSPDSLNLTIAQQQVRGVLEACPQAAVVFRLHLNPPNWWLAENPDEQVAYEAGTPAQPFTPLHLSRLVQDDAGLPVRVSLASERWRKEAGDVLARFCHGFSKTAEGDALIGIHVACGVYGEWHQWGFIEHEADFSKPMRQRFQHWLREKYGNDLALRQAWHDSLASFASVEIPTPNDRKIENGLFRSPGAPTANQHAPTADYYRCQHELVADDLLFFCEQVKKNWPRKILTGAFYGYFFSMFNRQAAGGHLALQRVLESPWIDYLSGPQVYYPDDGYDPGEPFRSRGLVASALHHGKLWLDEYDQQPRRTFPVLNGKDNTDAYRRNIQENLAAIQRNMLAPITRGAGLWFYDFGPSGMNLHRANEHDIQSGTIGYWDHPAYLRSIKKIKTLADSLLQRPWHTAADVLLVYDTEVFYQLKSTRSDSCTISSQAVDWLPLALHYAGVAYDAVHLDDLKTLDLSPYRAVVFANTWLLDEADALTIRQRVAQDGRHLFWVYAPGFTDGQRLWPEGPAAVTGLPLERFHPEKTPAAVGFGQMGDLPRQTAWGPLDPAFSVKKKPGVVPLAVFEHDSLRVAFARMEMAGHTAWYLAWPPVDARWWQRLLDEAGAHRYTCGEGVVYAGSGLLVFHSKTGGEQKLVLKNGKEVVVHMPPGAGTAILDAETGTVLDGG